MVLMIAVVLKTCNVEGRQQQPGSASVHALFVRSSLLYLEVWSPLPHFSALLGDL